MMKLSEVIKSESQPGTYAAVRFDQRTVNALRKYNERHKIKEPNDNWHTTLLYSTKHLPNYHPIELYDTPMNGTATEFDLFGDDNNILVLKFSCPELYQRHHKLMIQHGATYDFDKFEPHITLSYNPGKINIEDLPPFKGKIRITGEYSEELGKKDEESDTD